MKYIMSIASAILLTSPGLQAQPELWSPPPLTQLTVWPGGLEAAVFRVGSDWRTSELRVLGQRGHFYRYPRSDRFTLIERDGHPFIECYKPGSGRGGGVLFSLREDLLIALSSCTANSRPQNRHVATPLSPGSWIGVALWEPVRSRRNVGQENLIARTILYAYRSLYEVPLDRTQYPIRVPPTNPIATPVALAYYDPDLESEVVAAILWRIAGRLYYDEQGYQITEETYSAQGHCGRREEDPNHYGRPYWVYEGLCPQ